MFFFLSFFINSYDVKDPYFKDQFPIENEGRWVGISNEDIEVKECWDNDVFGADIPVAVIDDGCNYNHLDLNRSYVKEKSFNYKTWTNDAINENETYKSGTINAGNIAADGNNISIIGVAKDAKVGCFNIKANYSYDNLVDSLSRYNDYYRIKLIGFTNECDNSCVFEEPRPEITNTINSAPSSLIYVKPAGSNAIIGGDTNNDALSRSPRVIIVSDSNHRGARSAWSNRGTNIFCTVPSGGSSSYDNIRTPSSPGLSTVDNEGVEIPDPRNKGASYMSGAIALLLQQKPSFTWREVQYAIASSCTKIDPNHPSWVINGGKFYYSHIYGFGRLNTNWMLQISDSIGTLPDPVQISVENSDEEDIPVLRGGSIEKEVEINEDKINSIEYVTLSIDLDVSDFSALRIWVYSPQNTFSYIKSPSHVKESKGRKTYEFLIRTFYGETAKGKWRIKFVSDSLINPPHFYKLNLLVSGLENYNLQSYQRVGSDPYVKPFTKYEAKLNITSSSTGKPISKLACGIPFNFNVNISSKPNTTVTVTLGDSMKTSRWPLLDRPVPADSIDKLTIPCHFKNFSRMNISVENFEENIYGSKEVTIENVNEYVNEILDPQTYEIIRISSSGQVEIDFSVRMSLLYWIDGSYAQRARLSLYDMDAKEVIFSEYYDIINMTKLTIPYRLRCYRCLLSFVPIWYSNMTDECLNMIQPISILEPLEQPPEPWIIDISKKCPIPKNIKTPTPPPATPVPTQSPGPDPTMTPTATLPGEGAKQNKKAVIVGMTFTVVFSVFLAGFLWINRRKAEDSRPITKESDFSLIE